MGFSTSMRDFAIMEMNLRDAKKARQDKKRNKKELPELRIMQMQLELITKRDEFKGELINTLSERVNVLEQRLNNLEGTNP